MPTTRVIVRSGCRIRSRSRDFGDARRTAHAVNARRGSRHRRGRHREATPRPGARLPSTPRRSRRRGSPGVHRAATMPAGVHLRRSARTRAACSRAQTGRRGGCAPRSRRAPSRLVPGEGCARGRSRMRGTARGADPTARRRRIGTCAHRHHRSPGGSTRRSTASHPSQRRHDPLVPTMPPHAGPHPDGRPCVRPPGARRGTHRSRGALTRGTRCRRCCASRRRGVHRRRDPIP